MSLFNCKDCNETLLVNALSNGMAMMVWSEWNISSAVNVFAYKENWSPRTCQDCSPIEWVWPRMSMTWPGMSIWPRTSSVSVCTDTFFVQYALCYSAPITMFTPTLHCALIVPVLSLHGIALSQTAVVPVRMHCIPEWLESLLFHAHRCCVLRHALLGIMRTQRQPCLVAPSTTLTCTEKAPWP